MLLSNGDNLWGGGRDGEETGSSDWVGTTALREIGARAQRSQGRRLDKRLFKARP